MKLLVLNSRLSGYFIKALEAFKGVSGAETLIYAWPNQADAPFDISLFEGVEEVRNRSECEVSEILVSALEFKPDVVLVSGWMDKGYVSICRQLKKRGVKIISGCDTQWTGSWRQHVAGLVAPWHVNQFIDVLWVTGERQKTLANSLGYKGRNCWEGYYTCDWESFSEVNASVEPKVDPSFLYVGRYAAVKGLDVLINAYELYKARVDHPWRLVCAGAGEMRERLMQAGAEDKGFVQPNALPKLMQEAAAFVLPSTYEPWGVVAHEAAAAGLPLILSDACGAGVHLLKSHFNGFHCVAGDVVSLADALCEMHQLTLETRSAFGDASHQLARQYTPEIWALTLTKGLKQWGIGE